MKAKTIIIASHGTKGARAAEDEALRRARHTGCRLIHLQIVPDFWRTMRGDDWLNNTVTQKQFGEHLENELASEALAEVKRLDAKAEDKGVEIEHRAMFGKPCDCLLRLASQEQADMVIMGTPRPKGESGYSSRMKLEPLVRGLEAKLLIVPRAA